MQERVLVFAPHNDDEVLGIGGTLAKLASRGDVITVCEVTTGDNRKRADLIKEEAFKAHSLLGVKNSVFLDMPVVRLSEFPRIDLNIHMCEVVRDYSPTIAFIPHIGDMHTDHRVVADSAMVALRPYESKSLHSLFAYETLSETVESILTSEIPEVLSVKQVIDE